jgi:hypothetical protein
MVWRGRERDPRTDPAASDVMAAYQAATKAGLPTPVLKRGVELIPIMLLPLQQSRRSR